MPERSFFDLRYAIPGYTFIIWILGINHVPLLTSKVFGSEPAFGVFLAFLAFLGGSSTGFLVSQWWWWSFQRNVKEYDDFEESIEALRKKYGLIKPQDKEGKKKALTIHDYLVHSEENEKVHEYNARRWDMYHLFSSERVSLRLAVFSGFIYRILAYLFFLYQNPSLLESTSLYLQDILSGKIPLKFDGLLSFIVAEGWVQVVLLVVWVIMDLFLVHGHEYVKFQLCSMTEAIIKKSSVRREELQRAFSLELFDVIILGIDEKIAEKLRGVGIDSVATLAKHNSKGVIEKIRKAFPGEKAQISEKDVSDWIERAVRIEKLYS